MSESLLMHIKFLKENGFYIFESDTGYWFKHNYYSAMPLQYERKISVKDVKDDRNLQSEVPIARFMTCDDTNFETFRYVIKDDSYSFKNIKSRYRSYTRKGLKTCSVREISPNSISSDLINVTQLTFERQSRKWKSGYNIYWKKYFELASMNPYCRCWAVWYEDSLVGFLLGFKIDNIFHLLLSRFDGGYSKYHPSKALLYTALTSIFEDKEINLVSFGLESLIADKRILGLRQFKTSMGFSLEKSYQGTVFSRASDFVFNNKISDIFLSRINKKILPIAMLNELKRIKV